MHVHVCVYARIKTPAPRSTHLHTYLQRPQPTKRTPSASLWAKSLEKSPPTARKITSSSRALARSNSSMATSPYGVGTWFFGGYGWSGCVLVSWRGMRMGGMYGSVVVGGSDRKHRHHQHSASTALAGTDLPSCRRSAPTRRGAAPRPGSCACPAPDFVTTCRQFNVKRGPPKRHTNQLPTHPRPTLTISSPTAPVAPTMPTLTLAPPAIMLGPWLAARRCITWARGRPGWMGWDGMGIGLGKGSGVRGGARGSNKQLNQRGRRRVDRIG